MHLMTKTHNTSAAEIDLKRFMKDDLCLAMRTRRLSRILTRTYEDALRDYGLTIAQFTLLTAVSVHEPVTSAKIGRLLDIEKSTLSRTIGKMIDKGWVEEQRGADGERGIVMTPLGKETLRNAIPVWSGVQTRVKDKFGHQATKTLDQMIARAHEL